MALKICVVGCGGHSALVHGPACARYARENPDTLLAACCDLQEERAAAYRDRFGFQRCYTDMDAMLETEQPDAVCVIVPEHLVCRTSLSVINKGYHILLEKPPGLCLQDTEQLVQAAEKSGVINQVAFNRRHIPLFRQLRKMVHTSNNSVQTMQYSFYRVRRTEPCFETTAIHGIDAARFLMGSDYRQVHFSYMPLPEMGPGVVNILMDCIFENGAHAHLAFCPCTGIVAERVSILAGDESFFVNIPIWDGADMPGELTRYCAGAQTDRILGTDVCDSREMYVTNGFYHEDKCFFDHVRTGAMCMDDIRSTLQSVALAQAIRQRDTFWGK
jgi:myo-inositol 2-dehydrogenase/D-chiro-inositol 1-dehydrogenase